LYFDDILIHRQGQFNSIFPTAENEAENRVIWLKVGEGWPMFVVMVNQFPNQLPQGGSQCFPFYTYNEDGSNRQENITDWALAQFQTTYSHQLSANQPVSSPPLTPQSSVLITKHHIFHYIYALLHHPYYRETYAANLRRELPRIPFLRDFWGFVTAGERLADLHINYETQPLYPLTTLENPDLPLDYRVEKMRLARDKTSLTYNDFLTLGNIPPAVYEYKLGNRSALEWVIDQYQVKTDKRSGLSNDPNRPDDPDYILRLIGQVITVSLETVQIVQNLPAWELV
jgi:predicted helicase